MLDLRRSTAAALLVGAALVPALAAAPANAVGSSSTAVLAAVADWTYYGTYPDLGSCDAAGLENPYDDPWECRPSTQPGAQPGEYDLYDWSSDGPEAPSDGPEAPSDGPEVPSTNRTVRATGAR